ncbi:MAG: lysophospholipid acyltransferase family protein [Thermoanaerobaculales bacterium]
MANSLTSRGLYLGLRAFLGLGSRLPLRLTRTIGVPLGRAALRLSASTRKRIRTHLEIAFPELDRTDRNALMRAVGRHFGLLLAEVSWLWRASPEDVQALCELKGGEHFVAAHEAGRGTVLVTAHCGNWELLNSRLQCLGIPASIIVRRLDDPRIDEISTRLRTRFGAEVIHRDDRVGRRLIRVLADNRLIALLIDQDLPGSAGVFVPFFGRPAWTPVGAAVLALRNGSPLIPTFGHRRPDGTHLVEVHPPIPIPSSGTRESKVEELTAAAMAAIERQIRAHPEQWVWMHRRWRTQPD